MVPIQNGPRFIEFTASREISVKTMNQQTESFGEKKPQFLLFLKIADGIHSLHGR